MIIVILLIAAFGYALDLLYHFNFFWIIQLEENAALSKGKVELRMSTECSIYLMIGTMRFDSEDHASSLSDCYEKSRD